MTHRAHTARPIIAGTTTPPRDRSRGAGADVDVAVVAAAPMPAPRRPSCTSLVDWFHEVANRPTADFLAVCEAIGHRVAEVETDQDPRLAVLSGGAGETIERACDRRRIVACLARRQGQAADGETDPIGPEHAAHDLGGDATFDAVPRVVVGDRRLHATRERADPVEAARYMAARLPNAKLVELDSADHLIWLTDALDNMVNAIQDFVEGAVPVHDVAPQLATVLCVDVPPGPFADDAARQIQRHRGTIVNRSDGLFATFDGPSRAIRCATTTVEACAPARAGLHCGDCEITGAEVRGIAVTIARQLAR